MPVPTLAAAALTATILNPMHSAATQEPIREADGALSFPVAEGNWCVSVELGGDKPASTTIKAENRRLMALSVPSAKGQSKTVRFVVHVHNGALGPVPINAPGAAHVRLRPDQAAQRNWDDRLTLEFLGQPAVRHISIEPAQVPTLFLVGDSMVADHPAEPTASWGQMLPALLDDGVAVANYAESGATLKSFLADLRMDKALSLMKPGDYLFIQFGHNDQRPNGPRPMPRLAPPIAPIWPPISPRRGGAGPPPSWSPAQSGAISMRRAALWPRWANIRRPCANWARN